MLLWIEGFEGFGDTIASAPAPTGIIGRKYLSVTSESDMRIRTGRLGGYSLHFPNSGCIMTTPVLTTNATLVVGMAIKFISLNSSLLAFLSLYDTTTLGMNLRVSSAGELGVYRGSTSLATTSGLNLVTDTWYYIEFKVVCNNTTGSYEVRVGGSNVLSDSGLDTQAGSNAYHDRVSLRAGSSSYHYFDDLYCLDASGSSNNNFLGNMRVVAIRSDGDTTAKDWARSAGSDNYALVNEVECDDDTTYVENDTSTEKDLYEYTAVADLANSVKGIQINTTCRETDTNSFSLQTVVKSGTTESDDTAQNIGSTSYVTKTRLLETDPDTATAWTLSGINAAQFGIKVG